MIRISTGDRAFGGADPANFVMPAQFQRLVAGTDDAPVRLYRVAFAEGARTHWHRHDAPQLLFGLSGTCLVENRDGTAHLLEVGDVVIINPGDEHWHGAAPGTTGEHLAINTGNETTWLGP